MPGANLCTVQHTVITFCVASLTLLFTIQQMMHYRGILEMLCLIIIAYVNALLYCRIIFVYGELIQEFRARIARKLSEHAIALKRMHVAAECKCDPPVQRELACVVCMDHPRACRFAPCGHLAVCRHCSDALLTPRCPMCQATVDERQKTYL